MSISSENRASPKILNIVHILQASSSVKSVAGHEGHEEPTAVDSGFRSIARVHASKATNEEGASPALDILRGWSNPDQEPEKKSEKVVLGRRACAGGGYLESGGRWGKEEAGAKSDRRISADTSQVPSRISPTVYDGEKAKDARKRGKELWEGLVYLWLSGVHGGGRKGADSLNYKIQTVHLKVGDIYSTEAIVTVTRPEGNATRPP
ncbi:hypothetical protein C8R44DRAFT_847789 [Mycena epipterygia]|nr:hypothetical protein C8R44DRAFT_847789 [Mycena epipterygia]